MANSAWRTVLNAFSRKSSKAY
ncbi:unnamed protein product, partial [Rotaria magnacalcarata]